jgi:integral membrane sensor domain MASE1
MVDLVPYIAPTILAIIGFFIVQWMKDMKSKQEKMLIAQTAFHLIVESRLTKLETIILMGLPRRRRRTDVESNDE